MGMAWFRKTAELAARFRLPMWGLCVLAVFLNMLAPMFFRDFLRIPLFLDSVFTAAVAFAFGLVPGMFVAVFSWLVQCLYWGRFHFFVVCGIAEVLLIFALKPAAPVIPYYASKDRIVATYTGFVAGLMILYLVCAIAVSVLGGIIDYATRLFLGIHLHYISPEDAFRSALIMADLPLVVENILARVPVNLADRFVVVFGGYFISRVFVRLARRRGRIPTVPMASR